MLKSVPCPRPPDYEVYNEARTERIAEDTPFSFVNAHTSKPTRARAVLDIIDGALAGRQGKG
jgi:hypothetical protein